MSNFDSKSIRTYGRRQGRPIKHSKQNLLNELLPTILIELPEIEHLIDPQIYFNKSAPVWVEVGFGGGEHLADLAKENPHINFIGCEPFLNGVASLLNYVQTLNLSNIRIFQGNAIDLLKVFKPECISRFYLMFADPWPKKRHHKRRFIQHDILDMLLPKLVRNAELRIATDHENYQDWILKHLRARSELKEEMCAAGKPIDWPNTRYEVKAIEENRKPLYMIFRLIK